MSKFIYKMIRRDVKNIMVKCVIKYYCDEYKMFLIDCI